MLTVAVINLAIGRREFRPSIYGKIATATYILTCVTIMYFNYLQRTSPLVTSRRLRLGRDHADLGIPLRFQYHENHQSERDSRQSVVVSRQSQSSVGSLSLQSQARRQSIRSEAVRASSLSAEDWDCRLQRLRTARLRLPTDD